MPFEMVGRVGPRNRVLHGKGSFFWGGGDLVPLVSIGFFNVFVVEQRRLFEWCESVRVRKLHDIYVRTI